MNTPGVLKHLKESSLKTLIIIPTYNEVENIQAITALTFQVSSDFQILFVDDNSQDGTRDEIAKVSARFPGKIHLLPRAGKLGLGTAYVAGFRWGLERGFDVLIEMDADLSHNPVYLTDMLERLQRADGVIGSRYVEGGGTKNWSWLRKLISRGGSLYSRMVLGLAVRDLTGGFNGWHRRVLEAINIDAIQSEGYAFQVELKYRALKKGFRLEEFPIIFVDRRAGYSKMSSRIVLEAILRMWSLRRLKL